MIPFINPVTSEERKKLKLGKKFYLFNLLSVLILLQYCSGGSGSQNNEAESVLPAVEAVKARYGSLPLTQRFSGIVKAENQIEIYPEVTGIIVEVLAKNGDVVKKGAPLIRLREKNFANDSNRHKPDIK